MNSLIFRFFVNKKGMKAIKFSLNFVVKNFIIFLLAIAWTNFYIKPFYLSVIVACIITFTFSMFFRSIALKKEEKSGIKSAEKEALQQFEFNILTMPSIKQNEFLANVLNNKGVEIEDGMIYVKNHLVINKLSKAKLKQEDVYEIIKSLSTLGSDKAIIFYYDIEPSALELIKSLTSPSLELYDISYLYKEAKKQNIEIKSNVTLKKSNKLKFKQFIKILFARKNAKNYILLGIIMLLSSFIVFNPLFYVIYASIMFIFALICVFLKPEEPKSSLLG